MSVLSTETIAEGFPPRDVTAQIKTVSGLFELLTPNASPEEREQYIDYATRAGRELVPGLQKGIAIVTEIIPSFDFYGRVLPSLCDAVRSVPRLFSSGEIPLLLQGVAAKVSLSRAQVFALLAASFFQRLPRAQNERFGEVAWSELMFKTLPVGANRLACLLCYFHMYLFSPILTHRGRSNEEGSLMEVIASLDAETRTVEQTPVVFERVILEQTPAIREADNIVVVPKCEHPFVTLTAHARVEDVSSADAIVDFANKLVHIGCVINSATQEEVLFSVIPEAMLAVILFEELRDDEAGLIHNAVRYSRYAGYANTFRFQGSVEPASSALVPPAILIMDAIVNRGYTQFEDEGFLRDTVKAYLAFQAVPKVRPSQGDSVESLMPVVSTGGWGCGIFQGDQTLKFVQQLMAASMAKCKLVYSTFGSTDRAESFEVIAYRLQSREISVAEMCRWVAEFVTMPDDDVPKDFEFFILTKLR